MMRINKAVLTEALNNIPNGMEAKLFLQKSINKPIRLHMSEMRNNSQTSLITSGYVKSVEFQEESEAYMQGFRIQLMYRNGKEFGNTENFFGNFKEFKIVDGAGISDVLKVLYHDGSYFLIEVIQA